MRLWGLISILEKVANRGRSAIKNYTGPAAAVSPIGLSLLPTRA
jgi:hypothetical protein